MERWRREFEKGSRLKGHHPSTAAKSHSQAIVLDIFASPAHILEPMACAASAKHVTLPKMHIDLLNLCYLDCPGYIALVDIKSEVKKINYELKARDIVLIMVGANKRMMS